MDDHSNQLDKVEHLLCDYTKKHHLLLNIVPRGDSCTCFASACGVPALDLTNVRGFGSLANAHRIFQPLPVTIRSTVGLKALTYFVAKFWRGRDQAVWEGCDQAVNQHLRLISL